MPTDDPVGTAIRAQRLARQAQHAARIEDLAFSVGQFLRNSAPAPTALTARTGVAASVLCGVGAGNVEMLCNLPSGVLARVLQVCGATALQAEIVITRRNQLTGAVPQPDVVLPEQQLHIETRADLAQVLTRIREAAGLSILQLSRATGINRSQLYYLTDSRRGALPRKREQLRAVLTACGLTARQVEHVLEQWKKLRHALVEPESVSAAPESETDAVSISPVTAHSDWKIQLLGPVQLIAEDHPIAIGGATVRGLLALLAMNPGRTIPLDQIIAALWGETPPATARTIVHATVSRLRRVLHAIPGNEATLSTRPPGYVLYVDPDRVDVHRARALLDRALTAEPEKASELLAEALALWRGPALAGVPGSLRAPELEDLRLAVHGARVDADLELGRHAELIIELSPIVRANPLAERTAGQLMRALYHAGRQGDALEWYRTVSRATLRTLGVEPGADLRWLHERLLNDDLPAGSTTVSRPRFKQGTPPPQQLPPATSNFAGRVADLAWLDALSEHAEAGETVVGVVTGTPGIGKTSLVVWWAHRAAQRFPDGVLFASLRGFDPRHAPLEPAEVLTQFLLSLSVPAERIPEQVHGRIALYRSMIAGRRILVILDDVRSADQVRPLLPPGSQSMTLVTSRSSLSGLAVSDAAKLRVLDTLAPGEAVRLIEELAGRDEPANMAALARLCGYLPLALRIVGARLAANPLRSAQDLVDELGNERTRLSALDVEGPDDGVRAALEISFRDLPNDVAHTFLRLGVVQCVSVGSYLTAAIGGINVDEARRQLRVLAARNLLAETGRDAFVPHNLVRLYLRELAENELDAADREDVLSRSVRYYQAVADRARRKMLRIVDPLDFTGVLTDAQCPPINGFFEARDWFAAEWENLLEVLDAARAVGRHGEVWRLARVAHTYRAVYPLLDEWTRLIEIGIEAAERSDNLLGQCWMLISRCAIALTFELPQGCLDDAERALELASAIGDKRLIVSANIHLGSALTLLGRHNEAIETLRQAVEETDRTGDLELRGQALNNCAEAEKRAGRYIEAISHQVTSLEIDRTLGDDAYVVVSLNNLAEISLKIGQLDTAKRYVQEAIDLAISRQFTLQEGVLRLTLGRVLRATSDVDGAREQFALALKIYEDTNPRLVGLVRKELTDLDTIDPDDSDENSGWR